MNYLVCTYRPNKVNGSILAARQPRAELKLILLYVPLQVSHVTREVKPTTVMRITLISAFELSQNNVAIAQTNTRGSTCAHLFCVPGLPGNNANSTNQSQAMEVSRLTVLHRHEVTQSPPLLLSICHADGER
jgi:hypothetical protein